MPLLPAESTLDAAEQDYLWTLNFGPQHPATHTTLRIVLKLEGEQVVQAVPDIGYLHSGFEKIGEHLDYNQYVTVTDRMNYISPMANNVAWHHAVETLLGIELTPRCKYIRVIVSELARISDHLLSHRRDGFGHRGLHVLSVRLLSTRADLRHFRDALRRQVHQQLHPRRRRDARHDASGGARRSAISSSDFPATLDDMERLLNRNRIFVDRTKGVGVLTSEQAINRGASGPIARASGVTRDLRKDEPYLDYQDFDFQVCCAKAGDCFARYYVRMAEMRESLKIVKQAVDNLPAGPANVLVDERAALPEKAQVYQTIEGTITHFELMMSNRGVETPNEESYAAVEAPNGELGFYIVGDGSDVAYRARCRPPSFLHFAMFPHLIEGHTLSDVVAVLGSLNIIAAELDR